MNYNLSRGEELFYKEIENLKSENPRCKNGLQFMASLFTGKVGVMPEGNLKSVNFIDEKELLFELDAIPSYKKLSSAILYTLNNCKESDLVSQIKFVIDSYKNNYFSTNKPKIQNNSIDEKSLELLAEIEKNAKPSEFYYSEMNITELDENGDSDIKTFKVDNIDLIEDFDDDDLSMEGMRATGIIDRDLDMTSTNEFTTRNRNRILNGLLEITDDGSYSITCPYTGSKNVYQIDSSTYASFETDQPFRVVFNLADLKPD